MSKSGSSGVLLFDDFPGKLLLVLQTLYQIHPPSLDSLQHLNNFIVVRGPELDTVLKVQHSIWGALNTEYAVHDSIWYGIALWSLSLSCSSCAASQLLVDSQPPPDGAAWEAEKALNLC